MNNCDSSDGNEIDDDGDTDDKDENDEDGDNSNNNDLVPWLVDLLWPCVFKALFLARNVFERAKW